MEMFYNHHRLWSIFYLCYGVTVMTWTHGGALHVSVLRTGRTPASAHGIMTVLAELFTPSETGIPMNTYMMNMVI